MGYTSYFAGGSTSKAKADNSGNGTGAGGKGGYKSFYGEKVQSAPTDDQLKTIRQKQQQDQKAQQDQPKPQPQPKQSLLTKVKNAGKSIATGVVHDAEKAGNTAGAAVGGTVGLSKATFDAAHGNKKAAQSTAAKTNKTVNSLLDEGMGGQGGLLSSKQASSSGGGVKSLKSNFIKPVLKGAAEYGQYAIPLGKAAKGASVLERVAKPAAQNAVVGAGGTAANEKLDTGHVNLKDVAKGAAAGAALGAGGQLAHEGLHAGNDVTTKAVNSVMDKVRAPKALIQNAKTQSLLKAAEDKKTAAAVVESDKAVQQSKKLDQQIELVNAKKADGKFTNVDKVKVAQLKAQKEELAPKIIAPESAPATKQVAEAPVSAGQTAPTESAGAAKSIPNESSTASVAPTEGSMLSRVVTKPVDESVTSGAERGTSKVGTSIQEKAVARGLKDTFGEAAGYDKITIADQAKKAVALANDRPALEKVISGETPLPNGLRATALIKAVEEHPELSKDAALLNKLSGAEHLAGESSRSAQELRLAAERSDHSPVEAIRQLRESRAKAVEKKLGKPVAKAVNDEVKQIRQNVPKVRPHDWNQLIEALKC